MSRAAPYVLTSSAFPDTLGFCVRTFACILLEIGPAKAKLFRPRRCYEEHSADCNDEYILPARSPLFFFHIGDIEAVNSSFAVTQEVTSHSRTVLLYDVPVPDM